MAEVRSVANLNISAPKEKRKGTKRGYRGLPIMVPDAGGLEAVEPSSSHVGELLVYLAMTILWLLS